VLGTCAGLIMLASELEDGIAGQETLGGLDVTVRRNAFGSQVDSYETDVTIAGVQGPPVRVAFIRAPVVTRVGPGVEVIATLPDGDVVGVRQGAVMGVAFHPEITGDDRLHRIFVESVRSAGFRLASLRLPRMVCDKGDQMSGHSKWATTKHKKAVVDARRAKSFAKLIKNIEVAAKVGGPISREIRHSPTPSRRPKRQVSPTTTLTERSSVVLD
jgi:hypothetical protein